METQVYSLTQTQVETLLKTQEALQKGEITKKDRKQILVFASIPQPMIQRIMKGVPA